jgi:hypothetical protein
MKIGTKKRTMAELESWLSDLSRNVSQLRKDVREVQCSSRQFTSQTDQINRLWGALDSVRNVVHEPIVRHALGLDGDANAILKDLVELAMERHFDRWNAPDELREIVTRARMLLAKNWDGARE